MYDLLFLYLTRPHLGDAGICLLYFSVLHDSIVHDVCIYIYMCVCVCVCVCVLAHVWLIVHFEGEEDGSKNTTF